MKRKCAVGGGGGKAKKPKTISKWDRDIICLPRKFKESGDNSISYPRGRSRSMLGREGLIVKVHLTSEMTIEEVESEIRSAFSGPMGGDDDFQFTFFLQATGGSARSLSIPSVSSSFCWNAQLVAKLGNQRNTIYIIAEDKLKMVSIVLKMVYLFCTL